MVERKLDPADHLYRVVQPLDGWAVAQQLITNYSDEHKFGNNEDIGTAFESIWDEGGLYVYLADVTTFKISSSDTDDASGGTGARTIQLYGMDGSYNLQNETITLNGRTAVNTANTYLRVFRVVVRSAGSGEINAGDIYAGTGDLTNGVPDNVFAKIRIGLGQTLMALYTIPLGEKGYLTEWHVGSGDNLVTTAMLLMRPINEVFQVKDRDTVFRAPIIREHTIPEEIDEKTDIELRAKVGTGTAEVSGGYHIVLVTQ